MTKLQQMVYQDAYLRLRNENLSRAYGLSSFEKINIPSDKEIKEDGYEGAVDKVFQQMNTTGTVNE